MGFRNRLAREQTRYDDRFTRDSLKDAEAELRRLVQLYDEAENDEDPYERFIPIRNDLSLALAYYRHCAQRRAEFTIRRARK